MLPSIELCYELVSKKCFCMLVCVIDADIILAILTSFFCLFYTEHKSSFMRPL